MFETSRAAERVLNTSERTGSGQIIPGAVKLDSGDPDFPTPPHIQEAMIKALTEGYTHYAHAQGDPELRAELARQLTETAADAARYGADDVLITNGASGAIFAAIGAFLDPGDEVLIPNPSFSLYADAARFVNAEVRMVSVLPDFHLDFSALRAAITPRSRMLILNSPCNPTGVVYRPDELEALADLAAEHELMVMSDEAYDHILFAGARHVPSIAIPGLAERTIYVHTFSKTFAMTGWRLGYLAIPGDRAKRAAVVARTTTGAINSAVQRAALVAITTPSDWPERMLAEYNARRDLLIDWLRDATGISWRPPEGGFYGFLRYQAPMTSKEMNAHLKTKGVAVRSGTEFGPDGESYVRLSFAISRQALEEGVQRIKAAIAELQAPVPVPGVGRRA